MKLWHWFRPLSSGRKTSVSSAHPVSNLRLIRRPVPDQESKAEKQLRLHQSELQDWNQKYWESHNQSFNEKKQKFIDNEISESDKIDGRQSYDQLAVFYKRFLDENRTKHMNYSL